MKAGKVRAQIRILAFTLCLIISCGAQEASQLPTLPLNSDQSKYCPDTNVGPRDQTICAKWWQWRRHNKICGYGGEACCPETGECVSEESYQCKKYFSCAPGWPCYSTTYRWQRNFRNLFCPSVCPSEVPEKGDQCSISVRFDCKYHEGLWVRGEYATECTCYDDGWSCSTQIYEPNGPGYSDPNPNNAEGCPAFRPDGDLCTADDMRVVEPCDYGGRLGCPDDSSLRASTTSCKCVDDPEYASMYGHPPVGEGASVLVWKCDLNGVPCPPQCPTEKPQELEECDVEWEYLCEYDGDETSDPDQVCRCEYDDNFDGDLKTRWICLNMDDESMAG